MSDLIGVYGALAAAQAEFPAIAKTHTATVASDKGKYTYNYADLADILAAVRPVLAKHGLAVTQPVELLESGKLMLRTSVCHKDGSAIHSTMPIPHMEGRPQQFGSTLTYARRYALSSLIGIATEEDDDAAAAQDPGPTTRQTRQPQRQTPPAPRKLDTRGMSPEQAVEQALGATVTPINRATEDTDPWRLDGINAEDIAETMAAAIAAVPWVDGKATVNRYLDRGLVLTEHEGAIVSEALKRRRENEKQQNLLAAG